MRGERLMLQDICSYTVYGFLQISTKKKDMDLSLSKNVLKMQKSAGNMVLLWLQVKDHSWQAKLFF